MACRGANRWPPCHGEAERCAWRTRESGSCRTPSARTRFRLIALSVRSGEATMSCGGPARSEPQDVRSKDYKYSVTLLTPTAHPRRVSAHPTCQAPISASLWSALEVGAISQAAERPKGESALSHVQGVRLNHSLFVRKANPAMLRDCARL